MKRYLRCCLIFLISLALPLSGMAGIQSPIEPCPMKTTGMTMMADMNQDCCVEMSSSSDHGKPCKPGQECRSASLLQVSFGKPATRLSSPQMLTIFSDSLPTQTPSGVWRPPRA
ncbi:MULTISPECIES: hypothetical protein [Pseudomonas]|jgi:hypothetical protein|uniref:Uncharacterized protein n=2 Tax=Pseudomonas grimontii TaxID=129847 RepID=A0A5C5PQI0_9PSED|nr:MULTISPECIES: hypothetical protein [Pseudomonas]AVX91892.1 hypothetical protein PkP19E3_27925 [Pseudomonas koreensis]AVX92712.1 hypothetical protein PkP19E3_31625 [Pseudomonas koreensis]AVX93108.1 hypothetical protein PkP19E3_33685 [Pseudomonas koreensis]TWR68204.1 hypothetical protein FIV39_06850 [Pseudomonas grimontii]